VEKQNVVAQYDVRVDKCVECGEMYDEMTCGLK
jgi:hypothetical protein